ncbi:YIP1 family protein [Myxococcus fulvus]|uniref:YIP1 family protein n=1 Tax=Myxococcus fulvus TaxID=33 RepID=UPI003B9BDF87
MSELVCPFCQVSVGAGALRCGGCGASFLVSPPPDSGAPVCAVHPQWMSQHACERCGAFACAQCLRRGPQQELVCEACHARVPHAQLPWDQRAELGWVKAFWKTCVEVMLRPVTTFERTSREASVGDSLLFAGLTAFVGYFSTWFLYTLFLLAFPYETFPASGSDNETHPALLRGVAVVLFVICMLLVPLLSMGLTLVAAGLDHLVLKVAGAQGPFATTLRGHALAQGVYLAGLVPFCSMYVLPFWSLGVRVSAYRSLHGVGWGPAVFGALLIPALTCCIGVGSYVAVLTAILAPGAFKL